MFHPPLVTVTWFVSSHAPATAMTKPIRNVPMPPSVPPAPRTRVSSLMCARYTSSRRQRLIEAADLVAALVPPRPRGAREELQVRPGRAGLDDVVELVRLAGVLPLLLEQHVHLPPPRPQRAQAAPQ